MDTSYVKAIHTGLYISELAPKGAKAEKPNPVTFTVAASATKGDTTVSLKADRAVEVAANQILVFNAGSGDELTLVVTEAVEVTTTATAVSVNRLEGDVGDGIDGALTEDDEAEWNGLYRVLGTSEAPVNITEGVSELSSTTYDTGRTIAWNESDANSKSFNIPRSGRFKARDKAYRIIFEAAKTDRELYVLQVAPDENGEPAREFEGRVKVRNYNESNPAEGIYDVSYTLQGQGKPLSDFID